MSVFRRCPVCGEVASVQPEYSNAYRKVFKCEHGHLFRKANTDSKKNRGGGTWLEHQNGFLPG